MQRSAEWLRGAVAGLRHWQNEIISTSAELIEHYTVKLAEAEAREAQQPTAAEVIAAAERAMQRTADHICDSSPYEVCIKNCPECLRREALALIARWKEADHGH